MADPHRKRRGRDLRATLSVQGMPELMALLRRDMAKILRDFAADEPPEVAARLHEVAAIFETGLPTE